MSGLVKAIGIAMVVLVAVGVVFLMAWVSEFGADWEKYAVGFIGFFVHVGCVIGFIYFLKETRR